MPPPPSLFLFSIPPKLYILFLPFTFRYSLYKRVCEAGRGVDAGGRDLDDEGVYIKGGESIIFERMNQYKILNIIGQGYGWFKSALSATPTWPGTWASPRTT